MIIFSIDGGDYMFLKDSFPSLRDAHINFGKAEFDSLAKELESRDRFKNVSCYANNIRCNVRSFEQTYKRVKPYPYKRL